MIVRTSGNELKTLSNKFKAVAVVDPRQSGKTTLTKSCFPEKKYVSLENPDYRRLAQEDPHGFLTQYPLGVILIPKILKISFLIWESFFFESQLPESFNFLGL